MPLGKSLKEQLLKFVGLENLYLFGLAQGTKTCESRQCSVSQNWCPGGMCNLTMKRQTAIRPLLSAATALCLALKTPDLRPCSLSNWLLFTLSPLQKILYTDLNCISFWNQDPSWHSSFIAFLHLEKKPAFQLGT